MKLQGTVTALVTPMIDQQIDEEGLAHNIRYQIEQGIHGILLLGSTGESSTLTSEEHSRIISIGIKEAKGKVPILVGTESCSTQVAVEKTRRAKDMGADAALIVAPYFNKPTQEGIYRHFETIVKQVDLPVIVYNHPGRSAVNIQVATLIRLMELPGIIGIKEASENMAQMGDLLHAARDKKNDFSVFSGDDAYTYPMMAMGACGVISVASNLFPAKMVRLVNALLHKNFEEALKLHFELLPFFKAEFVETNPIPIKKAMELCGMPAGECRLPLTALHPENVEVLQQVLEKMSLRELLVSS